MYGMILFVAIGLGKAALGALLSGAVGFGLGRIKNALKLQRIRDLVGEAGHYTTAEARDLVGALKVHL